MNEDEALTVEVERLNAEMEALHLADPARPRRPKGRAQAAANGVVTFKRSKVYAFQAATSGGAP